MRKILLPIIFLFVLTLVYSQEIQPEKVNITVNLGENGAITATEHYQFPKNLEDNLVSLSEELGSRYSLWKGYIEGLDFHVCKDPLNSKLIFKTEGEPELILNYECNTAKKVGEDLLYTEYELYSFSFPIIGGLMTLPQNYKLTIRLDTGDILEAKPNPNIYERKEVIWEGPLSTAQRFYLRYRVPKIYTIPSITEKFIDYLQDPRITIALLALLIIGIAGREKIRNVITQWVSSNTDITKE